MPYGVMNATWCCHYWRTTFWLYLEPTAILFLPLASIVTVPAPFWPLFPAAKNIAVFCAHVQQVSRLDG